MLRTASSLPHTGLLTLGSDPARFQTEPPACYRASWQVPGPDFHRQATTSLRTRRTPWHYVTASPPVPLGARKRPLFPESNYARQGLNMLMLATGVVAAGWTQSVGAHGQALDWQVSAQIPVQ
jgi:hypothetical protein